MSTANETTPLIPNVQYDDRINQRETYQQLNQTIGARTHAILASLQDEEDGPIDIGSGPVDLVILLYALYQLCDFLRESFRGNDNIASWVARGRLERVMRQRLDDEVMRILDIWGQGEVTDESLYEALWRKWQLGQHRFSGESSPLVVDLKLLVLIKKLLIS
jgi:hypothetical protein